MGQTCSRAEHDDYSLAVPPSSAKQAPAAQSEPVEVGSVDPVPPTPTAEATLAPVALDSGREEERVDGGREDRPALGSVKAAAALSEEAAAAARMRMPAMPRPSNAVAETDGPERAQSAPSATVPMLDAALEPGSASAVAPASPAEAGASLADRLVAALARGCASCRQCRPEGKASAKEDASPSTQRAAPLLPTPPRNRILFKPASPSAIDHSAFAAPAAVSPYAAEDYKMHIGPLATHRLSPRRL